MGYGSRRDSSDKVAFLLKRIPPDYGGSYNRIYKYIQRNRDTKRRVILTFTKSRADNNDFVKSYSVINVVRYILWCDGLVVVSRDIYSLFPVLIARALRKKIIILATLYGFDTYGITNKRLLNRFKDIQYDLCSHIHLNCESMLDCFEKERLREKTLVLKNPILVRGFISREVKDRKVTILNVGAIESRKAQSDSVIVISELAKLHPERSFELVLIGPIREEEEKQQVLSYTLPSNMELILTGKQLVLDRYYANADLYIHTSREEGSPNAVLEAMSYSLPVVVKKLRTVYDFLSSDCVVEKDLLDMVIPLNNLINDRMLYDQHARRNWETINASYAVDEIDELYSLNSL